MYLSSVIPTPIILLALQITAQDSLSAGCMSMSLFFLSFVVM